MHIKYLHNYYFHFFFLFLYFIFNYYFILDFNLIYASVIELNFQLPLTVIYNGEACSGWYNTLWRNPNATHFTS